MVRPLALALALVVTAAPLGCRRDDDDEDEAPKKKKFKKKPEKKPEEPVDAAPEAGDDHGPKPKPLPDGDLKAPGEAALLAKAGGALALFTEGETPVFKYGRAQLGWGGLHVTLSTEKIGCAWTTPGDEAYQLDFQLAPGPGGAYYAGHPIGVAVNWTSTRLKLKASHAGPHQTKLVLDAPLVAKDGEHVKGTLALEQSAKVSRPDGTRVTYEYRARGAFDVVICPAGYGGLSGLDPLGKVAATTPVTGTFASIAFTAKSSLAIVQKDWASGLPYLESIELYETEDPSCADRWKLSSTAHLTVRAIGGSGTIFPMLDQQPMEPTFTVPKVAGGLGYPKWFGGGQRRGWIKLDALDLTSGGKIVGELLAESSPGSKADETGKMSGRFTAKVCGTF